MPVYRYLAKNGPNETVEGNIEAQSEKEAIEKISKLGYLPVRIQQGDVSARAVKPLRQSSHKVKPRQITIFSRQLASLLKAGVPILSALDIIREQSESESFRRMLLEIHNYIKDGTTFSLALAHYPLVFPQLYIAMVKAGEDSGTLTDVLLRIADYRSKQEEILGSLRMALAYPVLMAIVGIGTVVFMLTFVMPRLTGIFTSMGSTLPLPTRILISTSAYLRQPWVWLVTFSLFLYIRWQLRVKALRLPLSAFQLRIPVLGNFILKAELTRFSRTLELLIKNGIPILRAIDISIPVLENEAIKNELRKNYKDLEQGGSFGKSLKNSSNIFPLFMSNLISVGEESGRLDGALAEVANSYERDTDEAIKILSSLLEPLMILVMGLIVGFIVVAMLLPVFQINFTAQ
jgi:type II secretory pathway component PulF